MDKTYTELLRTLNENFIAFDLEHEVLTHFQTRADGTKWKNHKNAPDSYYLVKTKHRLLKGDRASDGSDSLSKHLNSQPFPHKDGPHYSVHKESVDIGNVARGMGVDPDNVIRGMGKGPHAKKDKARAAKEPKPTLKSRAKNVARGMGVDPDNVMRGMGFKESIDETNRGYSQAITQPLAPKEDRDRHDIVRDHEVAMRHHERQMSRDPENRSAHSAKAARHSAAFEAGKEVSFSAPGPVRDAAKKDFEVKSKKALGESVEVNEDHCLVCKDCGDELNKPTTDCKNDCSDPNGSHWVKEYNEDRKLGEEYVSYYDSGHAAIKKQLSLGPKGKFKNAQRRIDDHESGKEPNKHIAAMIKDRNKTNPGTNVVQLRREAVSFKEYAALDEVKDGDGVNIVKDREFKGKAMKKEPDSGKGITFANMTKSKIAKEEMSDEAKARVASLRNTPSQIAARKKAATNPAYKNTVRGTEADLNKGRPKWDQHDWDDKDAYPKESTEVDELAQMVPNKNFVKSADKEKMDQLSKDLAKLRGNLNRGPNDVITEEELEEAGWTPMMRRAAARRMKILAPRIKLGIKRSKNKTASKEKLMNRAVKSVKAALIKKMTRGERKVDLTPARRAEMEKRLKRLGPRIKQLAQKQVPATRKMERDRKKNRAK